MSKSVDSRRGATLPKSICAACAAIVSHSKGVVTISSSPTAARIALADPSGVKVCQRTTPATVALDASVGD
jgi:hypothetical protein